MAEGSPTARSPTFGGRALDRAQDMYRRFSHGDDNRGDMLFDLLIVVSAFGKPIVVNGGHYNDDGLPCDVRQVVDGLGFRWREPLL